MFRVFSILMIVLLTSGCNHSSSTWESMKTAGRYMQKGVDSVLGKDSESKMLTSGDEFCGPNDGDFIPLSDSDLNKQLSDKAMRQPKGSPGQFGIPTLDHFYAPPDSLKGIFSSVHFNTDQHVLKNKEELGNLIKLATYLKENPNVYLVIDGHCDERASASYNMALGMRRANAVRAFLVKQGADLDRIYTVSRGKEQPIALGHGPDDWKVNRRSEFRIFKR